MHLTLYNFAGKNIKVRQLKIKDIKWFVFVHFIPVLEFSQYNAIKLVYNFVSLNNYKMLSSLTNFQVEDKYTDTHVGDSGEENNENDILLINEQGLTELLLISQCQYAKHFRYWLVNVLTANTCIGVLKEFDMWLNEETNQQTLKTQVLQNKNDCVVYVITSELYKNVYKINCTYDINHKLKELDRHSVYDHTVVSIYETTDEMAHKLLRHLYDVYKSQRIRRDFFKMNKTQLFELHKRCMLFLNTNCTKIEEEQESEV